MHRVAAQPNVEVKFYFHVVLDFICMTNLGLCPVLVYIPTLIAFI